MDIFKEIKNLNFLSGSYVVVGSGPMVARGIRETQDIDIVVKPEIFEKYKQEGWEQIPWQYPGIKLGQIFLRRGVVELYLDVNSGDFNPTIEELLSRADIIKDIPFISLDDVIKFKKEYNKEYNKPKHLYDIELIERYMRENNKDI